MTLQYRKAEKISLRTYHDEKWLQDRIYDDPSILGLGDLAIYSKERRQSTGGRIDFLLYDNDTNMMYETEIMLGKTDESHIIRTIEYWDIESRRWPSKDHTAVIVAEEITNRFFNVISLMNKSIPIIAIQLNALKIDDHLILNFTKILDTYEQPEDEEGLGGGETDRKYWEGNASKKSIAILDQLISIVESMYVGARITYNKYHISIGTSKRHVIWVAPRKKEGYCPFEIKVGDENLDTIKQILDEIGIAFTPRKADVIYILLQQDDFTKHREKIAEIIKVALDAHR